MSTEVTTRNPVAIGERGVQLREMADAWRFCEAVHKSGLAPASLKSPEQIFVALQTGMESGLSPMAALRSIYVLDGKPGWYGDAAKALVIRSPLCSAWDEGIEGTGMGRTGWVKSYRVGMGEKVTRFAMEDAKRMGLLDKRNWKADPDSMLLWRATGRHCKRWYADLLLGLPVADEIEDRHTNGSGPTLAMEPAPAAASEGPKEDPLFLPAQETAAEPAPEPHSTFGPPAETPDDLPFDESPTWSGSFTRYQEETQKGIQFWRFFGSDGAIFGTRDRDLMEQARQHVDTGEVLAVVYEEVRGQKRMLSVGVEGGA